MWRTSCEAEALCSTTKVEKGFLNTKKKFKVEQEVVADLKVLYLKSVLKDEVKALA